MVSTIRNILSEIIRLIIFISTIPHPSNYFTFTFSFTFSLSFFFLFRFPVNRYLETSPPPLLRQHSAPVINSKNTPSVFDIPTWNTKEIHKSNFVSRSLSESNDSEDMLKMLASQKGSQSPSYHSDFSQSYHSEHSNKTHSTGKSRERSIGNGESYYLDDTFHEETLHESSIHSQHEEFKENHDSKSRDELQSVLIDHVNESKQELNSPALEQSPSRTMKRSQSQKHIKHKETGTEFSQTRENDTLIYSRPPSYTHDNSQTQYEKYENPHTKSRHHVKSNEQAIFENSPSHYLNEALPSTVPILFDNKSHLQQMCDPLNASFFPTLHSSFTRNIYLDLPSMFMHPESIKYNIEGDSVSMLSQLPQKTRAPLEGEWRPGIQWKTESTMASNGPYLNRNVSFHPKQRTLNQNPSNLRFANSTTSSNQVNRIPYTDTNEFVQASNHDFRIDSNNCYIDGHWSQFNDMEDTRYKSAYHEQCKHISNNQILQTVLQSLLHSQQVKASFNK